MANNCYIFDLDDTLYREYDYVMSGFYAVADYMSKLQVQVKKEVIYNSLIQTWKQNGRGKVFDVTCELFDINLNIDSLLDIYRNHKPKLSLYPDASDLLKFCKENDIITGIITDGNSIVQWNKIEALNLRDKVNEIIVSSDLGPNISKPSHMPYEKIAEKLGVCLYNSVYIGDNPHKDFITAKKLGMKTIRIIRSEGDHMKTRLDYEYEADTKIFSLRELCKYPLV